MTVICITLNYRTVATGSLEAPTRMHEDQRLQKKTFICTNNRERATVFHQVFKDCDKITLQALGARARLRCS